MTRCPGRGITSHSPVMVRRAAARPFATGHCVHCGRLVAYSRNTGRPRPHEGIGVADTAYNAARTAFFDPHAGRCVGA